MPRSPLTYACQETRNVAQEVEAAVLVDVVALACVVVVDELSAPATSGESPSAPTSNMPIATLGSVLIIMTSMV
jgi:hypothetical protein